MAESIPKKRNKKLLAKEKISNCSNGENIEKQGKQKI
jgi:hypothetical protein